jgi:hypothetical protein
MTAQFLDTLTGLQLFPRFRELIQDNIGYFPTIFPDPTGFSHQYRQYENPPAAEIRYSTRALARYIEIGDCLLAAKARNDPATLAASLCLVRGSEFARRNRYVGLALIASAFETIRFKKIPNDEILRTALDQSATGDNIPALINLLFPLAHEIGHLTEAQRLCPRAIHGDDIRETYRINYERVRPFTGDFNYARHLNDETSPLCLETLRDEAGSDFFAAAAITHLLARSGADYPLTAIATGIFQFPLTMTTEALCVRDHGKSELQQAILAMHCRYSLLIDSLRAGTKSIFSGSEAYAEIVGTIDVTINEVVKEFDDHYELVWNGFCDFAKEFAAVARLDEPQIIARLKESCRDMRRRLAISDYLDTLSRESQAYPISAENLKSLKEYPDLLRTFDTIIVQDNGVILQGSRF